MQDRIPTYPGRVTMAPVSGAENTYDMVRADVPIQEGTPLNKMTLLTDATAALAGLGSDATVNDMLFWLASRISYGTADLTAGSSSLENGKIYLVYK